MGDETPGKRQKVVFADEKTLEEMKVFTPKQSSVTPTSAPIRLPSSSARRFVGGGEPNEEVEAVRRSNKESSNQYGTSWREDLYHIDEEMPPIPKEEIDWEEGEQDVEATEKLNDDECLWRDGDQAPEEDPEPWVDRVADEDHAAMQMAACPKGGKEVATRGKRTCISGRKT